MLYSQPIKITKFAPGADSPTGIGIFEGVASTNLLDRDGDILDATAFSGSVDELNRGVRRVPVLVNHEAHLQIGGLKSATETPDGLLVTGRIVRGTPEANRAYQLAKSGDMNLSIGFLPVEGRTESLPSGGNRYKQVDWCEISTVSVPSNRGCRILRIKELAESSPREVEEMLREAFPEIPGRLAKKMAVACIDALNDDKPARDPKAMARAQAAALATIQNLKSPR